jgi:hypothetical protein
MTIRVAMDEHGGVWATTPDGELVAECFFPMDDETEAELRAWGYPRLVETYPRARLEVGPGLEAHDLEALFLELEA